ncbi:MAG: hypothetical protein JSW45_07905 [Thiotrichales bacterium]|nr:MAG: hypothetical protein JSW45_07905 [Thiotrichales bacterium]
MKDNMTTLLIVVLLCGIVYLALFNKTEQETLPELKHWFSNELARISAGLEQDIEQDRRGHYPHPGRQSFEPKGSITYTLLDKDMSRFELSQFSELTPGDIEATPGYQKLKAAADRLGLELSLEEVEVEGDGVSTWNELDEYVYDIPHFYNITVSGWSV